MSRGIPAFVIVLLVVAATTWALLVPDDGGATLAAPGEEASAGAGGAPAATGEAPTGDAERVSVAPAIAPRARDPRARASTLEIQLYASEPVASYVRWVLELRHRDRPEVRPRITGFETAGRAVARIREPGWYSVASLEDEKGRRVWQQRTGNVDPWFELPAGGRTRIELSIRRSGIPVGYVAGVVHVDGEPAPGLVVSHDLPRQRATVVTDGLGHFDLGAVYRTRLELRVDSLHWAGTVQVQDGAQRNLFIDIHPGTIRGVVVDRYGQPLAGRVRLAGRLPGGAGFLATGIDVSLRTDSKGGFVADRLSPGTYRVTAVRGSAVGSVSDVPVSAGVVRDVRVLVRATTSLRGKLEIPWLEFKKHKTALLKFSGPVDDLVLLSRSGRFRADDLVPGNYRVSLALGDLEEDLVEIELVPALLVAAGKSDPVDVTVQRPSGEKLAETLHRFGFGIRSR